MYHTKSLANLLALCKTTPLSPNGNLEVEMRVKYVDKATFTALYTKLKALGAPDIVCSVNVIHEDTTTRQSILKHRKYTASADGPIPGKEEWSSKKRISSITSSTGIPYSISASIETPLPLKSHFMPDNYTLVRFKVRASFNLSENWRTDLTIVRQGTLASIGASANGILKAFFKTPEISLANGISDATGYEIEQEYVGSSMIPSLEECQAGIAALLSHIDPSFGDGSIRGDLISMIGDFVGIRGARSIKGVTNQVITLTRSIYMEHIYPPVGWYATDKTDGTRAVLVIKDGQWYLISGTTLESGVLKTVPSASPPGRSLIDCEVLGTGTGKKLYAFDCIAYDGRNVSKAPIDARLQTLEAACEALSTLIPFPISAKKYTILDDATALKTLYEGPHAYDIDGLVLTSPKGGYIECKNYKWKPAEMLSIDFLARKVVPEAMGVAPFLEKAGETLYVLFVGIDDAVRRKYGLSFLPHYDKYFPDAEGTQSPIYRPIQFSPSAWPLAYIWYSKKSDLDNKVVELRLPKGISNNPPVWDFMRIREDKTDGNDFVVAESNFSLYIDPFTIDELANPMSATDADASPYFENNANHTMYEDSNRQKRKVINELFERYVKGAETAIDLCSGRGADLSRYATQGVRKALFVDIDKAAIMELIARKQSMRGATLGVGVLIADLMQPWKPIRESMNDFGIIEADVIVCNFALHYFCDTSAHLANFLSLVHASLRKSGKFIFTVMDGARVYGVLRSAPGGKWEVREDAALKYALHRKYKEGLALASYGQMIDVKLPFSETLRSEPLANCADIIKKASTQGFKLVDSGAFSAGNVTDANDKAYIELHQWVVLEKK